jgi:hypothetical protein
VNLGEILDARHIPKPNLSPVQQIVLQLCQQITMSCGPTVGGGDEGACDDVEDGDAEVVG